VQYLWGCPPEAFNDDRVARALDAMAAQAGPIHDAVVQAVLQRYPVDASWLHWDHSFVGFTDARRATGLVCAGYGNGQVHQRQAKFGVHVTSDYGVPVHYELLPGNAQQQPQARSVLKQLQTKLKSQQLGIVTDRGGIGYDIVAEYLQSGTYFVSALQATPAEQARAAQVPLEEFTASDYRSRGKPKDAYLVYPLTLPFQRQKRSQPLQVRALLVHSMGKQRTDAERRRKKVTRTVNQLNQLAGHLNRRQFAHADYVRRVADNKIRKGGVGQLVSYELTGTDGALELRVFVDTAAEAAAAKLDGRYFLVYHLPGEHEPDAPLKLHKRQYLAEQCFRNMRSDLAISPVWLHHDTRIAGLVLVYVLALTLLSLLGLLSRRAGLATEYYDHMTPMAMLRCFAHLQAHRPTARGQPPKPTIELTPDQAEVIRELNLPHPDTLLT
jgi:transposase